MEARVAVLEEIAAGTKVALGEIRVDLRELRAEIRTDLRELRGELGGMRAIQERDFRILFGAMIVAVLGLAGLMAHGFHWL